MAASAAPGGNVEITLNASLASSKEYPWPVKRKDVPRKWIVACPRRWN